MVRTGDILYILIALTLTFTISTSLCAKSVKEEISQTRNSFTGKSFNYFYNYDFKCGDEETRLNAVGAAGTNGLSLMGEGKFEDARKWGELGATIRNMNLCD